MTKKLFRFSLACLAIAGIAVLFTGCSNKFVGRYVGSNRDGETLAITIYEDDTYLYEEGAHQETGQATKGPKNESAVAYGASGDTLNMTVLFEGAEREVTLAKYGEDTLKLYVTLDAPHGKSAYGLARETE